MSPRGKVAIVGEKFHQSLTDRIDETVTLAGAVSAVAVPSQA